MAKQPKWDPQFTPAYSPMEMLDLGIFEGVYTAAIEGIPKKYKQHKNVLKRGSDPDPSINRFGVKSRLSLSEWKERGWTTKNSPLGWWQWYILYWLGRRLEDEDPWQIARWKSFVARHQGQITNSGDLDNLKKRLKQRQALLQWGWDSTKPFTEQNRDKALKRLKKHPEVTLESDRTRAFLNW